MEDGHSKKSKFDKKKDYKNKKPLCWDCGSPGHLKCAEEKEDGP